MSDGENLNTNEENSVSEAEKVLGSMPKDFNEFRQQAEQEKTSSAEKDYDEYGYKNLDKIDITSEKGRYEWLDSLLENSKTRIDDEYGDIIRKEGLYGMDKKEQESWLDYNEPYQDNRREYDLVKRQSKILENLDIDGDGGVLGALELKINAFEKAMDNPAASSKAKEVAYENWDAAKSLYFLLSDEMGKRDPEYFNQNSVEEQLMRGVKNAEDALEKSYVVFAGDLTDKGYIDTSTAGEKRPTRATEDAEIDLKYAKQDMETYDLLRNDYLVANNYIAPRVIKKEDFAPTVDKFIEEHSKQINQLMDESKTLNKGTPEYLENEAKRKQLAKERSSARRLLARYFNVPKAE